MSFKKYLQLVCLLLVFSSLYGKEDYRIEDQPIAIEKAISLSDTGTLKIKENGFVYLDVQNEFITSILPLLDHEGTLQKRPTAARSIGAHISVFHELEQITPLELGEKFSFTIKEIRSFTLNTRDGLKKLWVIAVTSHELEALREKYGLKPKLKGYDYHITLGKQLPKAPDGWEEKNNLSSLNFSNEAVDPLFSNGDFVKVEDEEILKTAQKVDAVGRLILKSNGYVYLNVDNAFVDSVWQSLPSTGNFSPTSTKPKKTGAHISVVYEDEMIGHEIWTLHEAGEQFLFEVKELRYIDRGQKRLWVLAVDSPALQRLRKRYGLKPKLQNHDFHITLGTEELQDAEEGFEELQKTAA